MDGSEEELENVSFYWKTSGGKAMLEELELNDDPNVAAKARTRRPPQ